MGSLALRSLILVALLAHVARAKIVISVPTVSEECPKGSWEHLTTCLKAFGEVRMLRQTKTVRVIDVRRVIEDGEVRDSGVYLYVAHGGEWVLGGQYGEAGELLAFEEVTIAKHTGYRLDFAHVLDTSTTLEDRTTVHARLATATSVYCGGTSYECTQVLTACDLIVHGKAQWTFRGHVRIASATSLEVTGDRTKAGDCMPQEQLELRWLPAR